MKQVTIKDVKKALNVSSNNELIMQIMVGLDSKRKLVKQKGHIDSVKVYEEQWDNLYNLLDKVGYFDDCKVVDK